MKKSQVVTWVFVITSILILANFFFKSNQRSTPNQRAEKNSKYLESDHQTNDSQIKKASDAVLRKRSQILFDLKKELREVEKNRIVIREKARLSTIISEGARKVYNLPSNQSTATNVIEYIVIEAPSSEEVSAIRDRIHSAFNAEVFDDDDTKGLLETDLLEYFTQFPKKFRIVSATQLEMARNTKNKMIGVVDTDQVMERDEEFGKTLWPIEPFGEVESKVSRKNLQRRYAYLFGVLEDL